MDTLTYLDELEKRGNKVVTISWVREQILAERTNQHSDAQNDTHSHLHTLD